MNECAHTHIRGTSPGSLLKTSSFSVCVWPQYEACRILVPWAGIEPRHLAVKAQSPIYETTREFAKPVHVFLLSNKLGTQGLSAVTLWLCLTTTGAFCQALFTLAGAGAPAGPDATSTLARVPTHSLFPGGQEGTNTWRIHSRAELTKNLHLEWKPLFLGCLLSPQTGWTGAQLLQERGWYLPCSNQRQTWGRGAGNRI